MPQLFGRSWTRDEIRAHFPEISQIVRLQRATLREGRAEGVDVVEVATGSGFEFTVVPGRALDISQARYKGIPLFWRSQTGEVAASYYEPEGLGWQRGAFGGLLTTGGLTAMGSDSVDNGESLGIHGRVSYLPASQVGVTAEWDGDDYRMTVRGEVAEASALGPNVVLTREISTAMGASHLVIRDHVENRSFERIEHMILYHLNLGAPLLSESARLVVDSIEMTPRDADSVAGASRWDRFEAPQVGRPHQLFYHRLRPDADGMAHALLVGLDDHADGPFAVALAYSAESLPWLVNWKCMQAGNYVTGIEPANAWVQGRAAEREAGRLKFLEPWASVDYEVRIEVLSGRDAIMAYAEAHGLAAQAKAAL